MPEYKLTYFNIRGMAEPIRLIFTVAGVPFEEERIERDQWEDVKSNFGFGQLPILHVDGRQLTQSLAIGRYLGEQFGLLAENSFGRARCDEVVDHMTEARLEFIKYFLEKDDEKKAVIKNNVSEVIIPKYYKILSQLIGENSNGPFIDGPSITWADLFLANWVEIFGEHLGSELNTQFPVMEEHLEAVYAVPAIKEYMETRPKTII